MRVHAEGDRKEASWLFMKSARADIMLVARLRLTKKRFECFAAYHICKSKERSQLYAHDSRSCAPSCALEEKSDTSTLQLIK